MKNKGSWLDIGVSISHFVIIESTAVVLCVLQIQAKYLVTTKYDLLGWVKDTTTRNRAGTVKQE